MRTTFKPFKTLASLLATTQNTVCAKTLYATIFQIGKPNYRFHKNRIRLPLQRNSWKSQDFFGVPRQSAFGEQALAEKGNL